MKKNKSKNALSRLKLMFLSKKLNLPWFFMWFLMLALSVGDLSVSNFNFRYSTQSRTTDFEVASRLSWQLGFSIAIAQDDLVEVVEFGTVKSDDPAKASKMVLSEVVERVTMRFAEEILGAQRVATAKNQITRSIIPNYEKFIPLMRKTEPLVMGDSIKVSYKIKVSPASLRALLLEEGILQVSDNPITILPLLNVVDSTVNHSFSWWTSDPSTLDSKAAAYVLNQRMVARLQDGFMKSGIQILSPVSGQFAAWLPDFLKHEALPLEEQQVMGQTFRSPVILTGGVQFQVSQSNPSNGRLNLKITAIQVKQGRTVAEVNETVEIDTADFSQVTGEHFKKVTDLAIPPLVSQLNELWGRAGLSVETLYLALKGDLGPAELEKFKSNLIKGTHSIKAVRDRKFAPGQVTLEMDSIVGLTELAKELSKEKLVEGFNFHVTSSENTTINASVATVRQ